MRLEAGYQPSRQSSGPSGGWAEGHEILTARQVRPTVGHSSSWPASVETGRTLLRILIGILLTVSACKPDDQLAWVRKADPARMVADDMRAGRVQFLQVCGSTCSTPGLGALTYAHCYRSTASTRVIDSTGSGIAPDAHADLKAQVARFAETYNRTLGTALDKSGKRTCGSKERWDDLWTAMNALARQVPQHPNATLIIAARDPGGSDDDFHLHVPDFVDLTRPLRERLCALVPQFGISGAVRFKVTSGDIKRQPVLWPYFRCLAGRVAA